MTDNEIIKALECCNRPANQTSCDDCPYQFSDEKCSSKLIDDTLALINRQKAEIEKLRNDVLDTADTLGLLEWRENKIRTEAIKEFAEMACKDRVSNDPVVIAVRCTVKEMTEE